MTKVDDLLTSLREVSCGEISCERCNSEREQAADEIERLLALCEELLNKLL